LSGGTEVEGAVGGRRGGFEIEEFERGAKGL